jgi:hypothetical protein
VREALKIAQFISTTFRVTYTERCLSACVYLFLAGGMHTAGGTVGIHRPYFKPEQFGTLSQSEAMQRYARADETVRDFLRSVRFPDRLTNIMFATPSDEVYLLSSRELADEIGYAQPWWQEASKAACPKREMSMCMKLRSMKERLKMLPRYVGAATAAAVTPQVRHTIETVAALNGYAR